MRPAASRPSIAVAFFRERLSPAPGGPQPIGLYLIMSNPRVKFDNMLANVEQDRVSPVVMIARKR